MTVVFITGASSGIGYATALAFAKNGTHVAGTARRTERLLQLQNEINALPAGHGEFLPLTGDVRDADSMNRAISQTVERFGRVDVVVANAGLGQRGGIVDSEWADIETLLRTNMDGVLHTVRAAVPEMQKSGGGHIIFISSIVYNMVSPYAATYAASKAFVSSIAASLRLELSADHIDVTDMLIGRTESEFSDKRLGQAGYGEKAGRIPRMTAEQVAEAILKASHSKRKRVAIRWFDRIFMMANLLVPNVIGNRAMRQYK
ncbi:MAG: SDR family NAD(P)-dependent oxidoreductase [Aggregatilineales bacterium]